MKEKFAAFLVRRSKAIMIIFIILALGFAALIPFVNVNTDMTKYLPKDSEMRQGLTIMEAEFGKEHSSNLKVMFHDLDSQAEKDKVAADLAKIKYVESVDYEADDKTYNEGKYTLYVLNADYDKNSDESKYIYDTVQEKYKDHEVDLAGSIYEGNVAGLPLWIAILAVCFIFLILFIMANSYVEPLTFLVTIAVAVLINMGSYIFFPSISNTTFGIVAILQLALSMDYSIMLLNRYRQERALTDDKREAMRKSLALSFGAITGSSLTTFAGLLALLFMSFKIGADIGLALAKGVIISLICIFTVLPSMILALDGLMLRTVKKTPNYDRPKLSKFQFKFRVPITLIFVGLFALVFFLKGNIDYSYSQVMTSKINDVFGYDNQIVMIYDTDDQDEVAKLSEKLEDMDCVRSVASYEGTIGKKMTADEMYDFIKKMAGSGYDMDLNKDMLRLIYYDYHAGNNDITMTLSQFTSFLQNDLMNSSTFADYFDSETRSKINDMAKFTNKTSLQTKMNATQLASFFGMTKTEAAQLMLYYNINNGKTPASKMSVPTFVSFLLDDVAKDPIYGKMFDEQTIAMLKNMQVYTDKNNITTPFNYQITAQMLGLDENLVLEIFNIYEDRKGDPTTLTLTLQQTINFMMTNEEVKGMFPAEALQSFQLLQGIINYSVSGTALDYSAMAQLFGMDANSMRSVFLLRDLKTDNISSWKMTPAQFINFLVDDVMTDPQMKSRIGSSAKELVIAQTIVNNVIKGTKYSAKQMSQLFADYSEDMKESNMSIMYKFYGSKYLYDESWTMDLTTMIRHLDEKIVNNEAYSSMIDSKDKKDIKEMRSELDDAAKLLKGKNYGRMIITADLEEDSVETRQFMDMLVKETDQNFDNKVYFVGNTPMAYEMSQTFKDELNKITLITALFILLIVLLTFRRLATPIILVLIIQCAVYVTMTVMTLMNYSMNYLALLIVQSIMMGATIDYAIVYSTYYVEKRELMGRAEAIRESFKGSLQTILTSALILIVAVGILSFAFSEPATQQICRILSAGCLTATLLVIFVLPAILACMDKLVINKKKKNKPKQ